MLDAPAIAGVYRQVGPAETVAGDGTVTTHGAEPDAQIIYTADGYYSFIVSPPGRPELTATESPDLSVVSEDELRSAVKAFVVLAGPFTLHDGTIEHRVDISLNPALVGVPVVRRIQLDVDGFDLELSSIPADDGSRRRVRWARQ